MTTFALTEPSQARYNTEIVTQVSKFLDHYLNSEYSWTKVGNGVETYIKDPMTPAEEHFAKPRVIIRPPVEEEHFSSVSEEPDPLPGQPNHRAKFLVTFMRFRISLECCTDEHTGSELTALDLQSSVRRICEMHGTADFGSINMLYVSASPGDTVEGDGKLYVGTVELLVEFTLLGGKVGS